MTRNASICVVQYSNRLESQEIASYIHNNIRKCNVGCTYIKRNTDNTAINIDKSLNVGRRLIIQI